MHRCRRPCICQDRSKAKENKKSERRVQAEEEPAISLPEPR